MSIVQLVGKSVVGFRDLGLGRQGDQGFNLYFCFRFRVQDFAV